MVRLTLELSDVVNKNVPNGTVGSGNLAKIVKHNIHWVRGRLRDNG